MEVKMRVLKRSSLDVKPSPLPGDAADGGGGGAAGAAGVDDDEEL
jgi:hypothetical protein